MLLDGWRPPGPRQPGRADLIAAIRAVEPVGASQL